MIKNNKNGFIALISVIIISFVLLLMTITLNFAGFSARFNIFDSESKEQSNQLANACIDSARLAIGSDEATTNKVVVDIDDKKCAYKILNLNEITAHACVNKAETFYKAVVDTDTPNIPITSFLELSNVSCELSTCP